MNKAINIIFDYDGTLHNSIRIYGPAFRQAYSYLVKKGYAEERSWCDKEISRWLGFSSKDMWNNFMPNLSNEEKEKCSALIGTSMLQYIKEDKAELYPGAIETLEYLKDKGLNLIFLSNCKIQYMNEHRRAFSLDKYFSSFYCTEEFDFSPKYKIFNSIKEKYKGHFIVIGDRYQDIEIAKIHNLYSIGCEYGYGSKKELNEANIIIKDILDLRKIINNVSDELYK